MTDFIQDIFDTAGEELPVILSELIDIIFSFISDLFLNFFVTNKENFTGLGNTLFTLVFDNINLDSADFFLFFIGGIFIFFLLKLAWQFISNLF